MATGANITGLAPAAGIAFGDGGLTICFALAILSLRIAGAALTCTGGPVATGGAFGGGPLKSGDAVEGTGAFGGGTLNNAPGFPGGGCLKNRTGGTPGGGCLKYCWPGTTVHAVDPAYSPS